MASGVKMTRIIKPIGSKKGVNNKKLPQGTRSPEKKPGPGYLLEPGGHGSFVKKFLGRDG
jgi:hypothetical protein